ncbi:MAG TPA: GNAT family N-acetyltransferase [Mycobacteriales bacterium]|nr:GNAT family N-acetyltransferase [Mycobacteriales bacterium]
MPSSRSMELVSWGPNDMLRNLDALLDVYSTAMDYHRNVMEWRRGYIASHAHRSGFRAVATFDDDRLVGFCYGYRGQPGQWWHDQVSGALVPEGYRHWLADCFEVVELHVHPDSQGAGLGERQLSAVLADAGARTAVLSTPEQAPGETQTRAWRLYRRYGFKDVVRGLRFPGDERPFAVLGRTLPLDA